MKLGFRTPSISKKIAAKTSVKRMVRNTTGVKAPKGMGIITDPKKAVSNKIYNKTTKGTGCLVSILILLVSFLSILIACSNENPSLATVKEFLKQNPKYGNINGTSDQPDWSEGKRIEVRTNTGNYLFYLSNNEVVGIWKYEEDGTRTQLLKKEITQPEVQITKDESLPDYKILFQVKLMSGAGKYGEILIQSYSKETPKEERENTLRKIIKKEGFVSAALYSTEDAYKANSSESFSKANPNALKNGYLGQITEKGIFIE